MKCMCTVFAMLLIFISVMAPTVANEADWMPDANLRAVVRSTLSIAGNDALTQQAMQDLTSLTAWHSQISDITGLEYATELTNLEIRDNAITDVTPLSTLTNLEVLRLKGNTVSDISALSGLINLTLLNLRHTGISSVSALSGLTNLEHLRVDDNSITDVEPLTSLTNLSKLWIARNSLTNAHLLSSLTNLTWIDITIPDPPDTTADPPDTTADPPDTTVQDGAFDVTTTFGPNVFMIVPTRTVRKSNFEVTIYFTRPVSDFEQADLSLSGTATASITSWFTRDSSTFTVEITPTTSGTVIFDIDEGVATDAANNPNNAAPTETVDVEVEVDVDPPTVEISVPSGTQTSAFDVTITFSESVSDFSKDALEISGDANVSIRRRWTNKSRTYYTFEVTPTTSGTVTFNVAENVVTDAANNPNTAATPKTVTVASDTTPPTVSILAPTVPQSSKPFEIIFQFSEEVTDFNARDISLAGSTATVTIRNSRRSQVKDGMTRAFFSITPETGGDLVISLPEGVVEDTLGNPNTASTEETISINFGVPYIVSIGISKPSNGVFTITITFSEEVSDFEQEDLVIKGNVELTITAWESTDNIVFTVNLTATSGGELEVYVPEGVVTDADGNLNPVSHGLYDLPIASFELDPPTVTVSVPTDTQTGAFKVTIDFSEYVRDFEETGVSLADSTAEATITGFRMVPGRDHRSRNLKYKATITPTTSGTVVVSIPADVCTDGSGNSNTASDTHSVTIELAEGGNAPSAVLSRITGLLDTTPLASLDLAQLEEQLQTLRVQSDGSAEYLQAIALLERTLAALQPVKTLLLANYPNPFNPETWIPYQLAAPSNVRITIYDARGTLVRQLDLGHQREGYYTSRSRAAYWDGRNDFGERVASGLYFYQFQADNMSLLRKMLILK